MLRYMAPIYLDRNESQYGPSPRCLDVLSHIPVMHLTHYTRDFNRGVKSRVSEKIAQVHGLKENQVALGYGSEGLIKLALARYTQKQDTVLLPQSSWWYYQALTDELGLKSVTYQLDKHNNTYKFNLDHIVDQYHIHQPRIVFIASPNNPTGNSLSPTDLRLLVKQLDKSLIMLDEAYVGYEDSLNYSVREFLSCHENVIIFRTFSKYYALAGLRMGYALVPDALKDFEHYTMRYLGYSQVIEEVALAALSDPDYYKQIKTWINQDKELFYQAFKQSPVVTCYHSDTNFLLLKLPPVAISILQKKLNAADIQLKFFKEPAFINHIRLSLGTQAHNQQVLTLLQETESEAKQQM